jgi:Synergist-CTERM protein sorting domain-containing protein
MREKICVRLLALLAVMLIFGAGDVPASAANKITSLKIGTSSGENAKAISGSGKDYTSSIYFMPNAAKDATVTVGLKFEFSKAISDDDSIRIVKGELKNVTDLKFSAPGKNVGSGGDPEIDSTGEILKLKSLDKGADEVKVTFKVENNNLADSSNKAVLAFQYYNTASADVDSLVRLTLDVKPIPALSIDPAVYKADRSETNGTPVSLTIGGINADSKTLFAASKGFGWYKGASSSAVALDKDKNNAVTRLAAVSVSSTSPGDTGLSYGSDILTDPKLIFSPAGKGPKGEYEYWLGVKSNDEYKYDGARPVGYVQAEGYTFASAKVVITDDTSVAKFSEAVPGTAGLGEYHNGEVITRRDYAIETPVYYMAGGAKPGSGTKIAFKVSGKSHNASAITPSVRPKSGWDITTMDGASATIDPDKSTFNYEDTIVLTKTATGDLPEAVSINLDSAGDGGFLNDTYVISLDLAALDINGEPVSFDRGTAAAKSSYFTADAGKWGKKYVAATGVSALYIDGDSSGVDYAAEAHSFWGGAKAARITRDVDNTPGSEVTGISIKTNDSTGPNANTFKVYLTRSVGSPIAILSDGPESDASGYAYWGPSLLSINIPFEAKVAEIGSGGGHEEITEGPTLPAATVPAGKKVTLGFAITVPGKNVVSVAVDANNAVIKDLAAQKVTVKAEGSHIVITGNPMPNVNKTYNIPVTATLSDGSKRLVTVPVRTSTDGVWNLPDGAWVLPNDDWDVSGDASAKNNRRSGGGCDAGLGVFALAAAAAAVLRKRG